MHTNPRFAFLRFALVLVLVLGLPYAVSAQDTADLDNTPLIPAPEEKSAAEDAELQEEPAAFGHVLSSGALAVSLDTAAVFCPDPGILVVHPRHTNEVLAGFNAKDNGDGTWTVPDPDDGRQWTLKTQFADSVFDDGRGGANAEDLKGLASLPVVDVSQVVRARWLWPRCWRLRLHYRCGVQGTCPFNGQCINGFLFTQNRNFLRCTYAPWNLCLEWLSPVCRVTRYTCRDCTGPIIFRRSLNRFVCAVF